MFHRIMKILCVSLKYIDIFPKLGFIIDGISIIKDQV